VFLSDCSTKRAACTPPSRRQSHTFVTRKQLEGALHAVPSKQLHSQSLPCHGGAPNVSDNVGT
jgi:hypothetical protein